MTFKPTDGVRGEDCGLCTLANAWTNPRCVDCPSYKKDHYVSQRGVEKGFEYACVSESPSVSHISRNPDRHPPWDVDIEQTVYTLFTTLRGRLGIDSAGGFYTYAVHCNVEKPSSKHLKACMPTLHEQLLTGAAEDRSIMVFAMGITVLKALGIPAKKYGNYIGNFTETSLSGRRVIVYGGLSKRQLMAKSGFVEILSKQIEIFLEGVKANMGGKPVEAQRSVDDITKTYIFPKTLHEVDTLVNTILDFHTPGSTVPNRHPIAIDTETNTKFPHRDKLKLLSVIISWGIGRSASIPVEHPESPFTLEELRPILNKLFMSDKPKVFHNAKFDLKVLWRKGFQVHRVAWDTLLAEHLLSEDKKGFYGLKEIVKTALPAFAHYEDELHASIETNKQSVPPPAKDAPKVKGIAKTLLEDDGFESAPLDKLNKYGAIDGEVTWRLASQQMGRMHEENLKLEQARKNLLKNPRYADIAVPHCTAPSPLRSIMRERTVPVLEVLTQMELHGMPVDREYAQTLADEMDTTLTKSHIHLNSMMPPYSTTKLNPDSTQQLTQVLFGTGYVDPKTGEGVCYKGRIEPPRTDKGQISTNKAFLRTLITQFDCPFCRAVLQYRAIKKARTTFVENIIVLSAEDGRMHSNFHQNGTSTGRLCVSENTVLSTDRGMFRISKLDLSKIPNVSVMTHTGNWKPITAVFCKGQEEMYSVELENGNSIEVTANHRFLTPNGFEHLKNLKKGDEVTTHSSVSNPYERGHSTKCIETGTFSTSKILKIRPLGIMGVWDISVKDDHTYVAHGFVNHNSSSHENMQNIPKKIGDHNIKRMFVPTDRENMVIANADAKAAEVRIYAAYSKDANLIKALNDGMDPHSFFASMVFNPANILTGVAPSRKQEVLDTVGVDENHSWCYDDFCMRGKFEDIGDAKYGKDLDKLRTIIKRVVFGILYGAAKKKISSIVGIPDEQAQLVIDTLFKMFPTIPEYIAITQKQVQKIGIVETFIGRRRRFDCESMPFWQKNKAERQAVNFKIQSTSSDIVLSVLAAVDAPLRRDLGGQLLNTVHDSLVMQIPKKYVSQVPDLIQEYGVRQVAAQYPWLPIQFQWDVEVGATYGDLVSAREYMAKNGLGLTPVVKEDYLECDIREEFEEEVLSQAV